MPSYLPNVQTYIPQLEPFTPDYKFLQDVLQIRQDRYDTNYKAINDLYGQVVYAPLSRESNKIKRDQYANQLSSKLKQVSGLDLSLQQNAETAKALFRPFYEDKNIVKDLMYTKGYQSQKREMERYKNSTNRERRELYWRDGDVWMDYEMQDFINGTDEAALAAPMPRYVKNPNLFMEGQRLLSDPNGDGDTKDAMSIKYTTFEGDYMVQHVNGMGMTSQPYTDENGETKYRNVPMEFLAQAFQDDPKIKEGYFIQAKVREREWAEANKGNFGGDINAAKRQWRNDQLTEGTNEEIIELAKLDTELKGDALTVEQWEEYKKTYGIKTGSVEDDFLFKKQVELNLKRKTRDKLSTHIQDQKAPTDDEMALANKAYGAYMYGALKTDMYNTAVQYATRSHEKTYEVNKAELQRKKLIFEAAKIESQQIHDMNMEAIKHANDMELQKLKNKGKSEGGDGKKGSRGDIMDQIISTWNDAGDAARTGEAIDVDVIAENWGALNDAYEDNTKYMFGFVEQIYDNIGDAASVWNGGAGGGFDISKDPNNPNVVSMQEAKSHFLKAENYEQLKRIYNQAHEWYSDVEYVKPKDGGPAVALRTNFRGKWGEKLLSDLGQLSVEIAGAEAYLPEVSENFKKIEQQGLNILKNQEPNSQYAVNARNGYGDLVVTQGYYDLGRYGFTDADIFAPEDAVRSDGQNHWDWIEEQVPWLVDEGYTGTESFRSRIFNSPLIHLSKNEYRNMVLMQTQGRNTATVGTDGSVTHNQDGLADLTNYLNSYYGNGGKNENGYSPFDDPNANNFMSRQNSLRGEVWYWDGNNGWQYNKVKALELADTHYDDMIAQLNTIFTHEKAKNGEYPTPHVFNDLYGQDEILGSDQIIYPKNFSYINSVNIEDNPAALDNFYGLTQALKAPDATTIIKFGNYETEFPDETTDDAAAKLFLQSHWLRDFVNGDTEADERNATISWSQMMGGQESRVYNEATGEYDYYSGYILTIPPDEMKKYAGLSLNDNDGDAKNIDDLMKGTNNQITILVKEEFDRQNNPKNMSRNRPNALQIIIDNSAAKTYQPVPIEGGGEVVYYVNGNGQYMERITMYGYNPETGNFEPDAGRHSESVVDVRKLNAHFSTTQEFLKQNAAVQWTARNNDINEDDKK
jgi:hypothetical protein